MRDCLLPFPSNRLTVSDPSTPTGLRVSIPVEAAPVNVDGVAMSLDDQNRADGFSPSSAIVFAADGVDLAASGVPSADDIGASVDGSSPISIQDLDADGEPWPYFGELDEQSGLVTLRPARLLTEGHTYLVTIGDLVTATGQPVAVNPPQWRFTVASADSLAGRLLSMLDQAYALLDGGYPSFTVDAVTETGGVRVVDGTFEIPNFLDNDGSPGGRLVLDNAGMPVLNAASPDYDAAYRCVVPTAPAAPVPTVVYGHGLLGDRTEVDFFGAFATTGIAACATDWLGMSSGDIANLAGILGDMGRFGEQADRMLAGHVAFQMLGRLANGGFNADAAFNSADGSALLLDGGAQFVGNSQGGILGGAATAVSREWSRAVLGVPGTNYSLLLPRSSDWPQFQAIFEAAYPDVDDRLMAIMLAQMLWDRGENAGYAQHLTADPYEGLETKTVLLVGAFGDHQVANVATDLLARTIGARIHSPSLLPGRATAVEPFWGIEPIDSYPFAGTGYVMWDFGTPAPPVGPTPPFPPDYGSDPHGAGSSEPLVLQQALSFLLSGLLQDVCAASPCLGRQIDG
ncbi:MAG: hypothetical protein ACKO27_06795 [Ilumatobacteraceae bacterium]